MHLLMSIYDNTLLKAFIYDPLYKKINHNCKPGLNAL